MEKNFKQILRSNWKALKTKINKLISGRDDDDDYCDFTFLAW